MSSKEQRRKQLARARLQRRRAREERAARGRKRRNVMLGGVLGIAVTASATALATGVLSGSGQEEPAALAPDSTASEEPADLCAEPGEGEPGTARWDTEPALSANTSATHLKLQTNCGTVEIELDSAAAPRTVNSFAFLAREGYFDHTRCHRLVTESPRILQCGDPEGTGQGGPGYTLPDENLDAAAIADGIYPAGTVAMANQYDAASGSGRDSGGSQFFMVYEDSELPPDYTPFGTVTTGMDVLRAIADAGDVPDPATGNTAPRATVVIDRATVTWSSAGE